MRLTGGSVSGRITVNGRKTPKARFRSISTYVPQVHVPPALFTAVKFKMHA